MKANKKIKSFANAHWDAQKAEHPLFMRHPFKKISMENK